MILSFRPQVKKSKDHFWKRYPEAVKQIKSERELDASRRTSCLGCILCQSWIFPGPCIRSRSSMMETSVGRTPHNVLVDECDGWQAQCADDVHYAFCSAYCSRNFLLHPPKALLIQTWCYNLARQAEALAHRLVKLWLRLMSMSWSTINRAFRSSKFWESSWVMPAMRMRSCAALPVRRCSQRKFRSSNFRLYWKLPVGLAASMFDSRDVLQHRCETWEILAGRNCAKCCVFP